MSPSKYLPPRAPCRILLNVKNQHPLLGTPRHSAGENNQIHFESQLRLDQVPWLGEHRMFGDAVFPASAYLEMAISATGQKSGALEGIIFEQALQLSTTTDLRTIGQNQTLEINSRPNSDARWTQNFSAQVSSELESPAPESPTVIAKRCPKSVRPAKFYEMFENLGVDYGERFRCVEEICYNDDEVLTKLSTNTDVHAFALAPTLLDGALQSLTVGLRRGRNVSLYLPVSAARLSWHGSSPTEIWCHARWNDDIGNKERSVSLTLFDKDQTIVAYIDNLKVCAVTRTELRQIVGADSGQLVYEISWRNLADLPKRNPDLLGIEVDPSGKNWLIVAGEAEATSKLANELRKDGQTCTEITLTDKIDWNAICTGNEKLNGIVWVCGTSSKDLEAHCTGLLRLIHGLHQHKIELLDRGFHLITQNATPHPTTTVNPHASLFWGLGRVIHNEHPPLRSRLIDVETTTMPVDLAKAILTESQECQLALRSERWLVPRLVPAQLQASDEGLATKEEASYLITGGLGMLGRRAAMLLAKRGARDVILVSRRAPGESAKSAIAEIEKLGCRIHVRQADISDLTTLKSLFDEIDNKLPPLAGVIHASGVVDDGLFGAQTWKRFKTVFAPKVSGAWNLHELTRSLNLDFFVLYSSAASVIGSPGQANYAAANAFLDGLAHFRHASGLPATSINFGAWNEGLAAAERAARALAKLGMSPITADEGHQSLDRIISADCPQATVMDVNWARLKTRFPYGTPALLDEVWPSSK